MTEPNNPNPERPPRHVIVRREEKEDEPKAMLAIIMAGIGALFIFSIVMAFNYASHSVDDRVATSRQQQSTGSTTGSGGASTTGSGGSNR